MAWGRFPRTYCAIADEKTKTQSGFSEATIRRIQVPSLGLDSKEYSVAFFGEQIR